MQRHLHGLSLLVFTFGVGCGKGAVGEAVRPEERTGAEALGEASPPFDCTTVAPAAEPLVVDWADHDRLALGIKLRDEGVAVVHYGCDGMRLLKHCKIEGTYRFAGSAAFLRVIELESADTVQASLPVQGMKFAAQVGGNSKIDIATAIIGRLGTLVSGPSKAELVGDECSDATHYVRSAYVGAFSMATGTRGEAAAAVDIFKFAASGASSSSRSALTRDGDLAVCESYDPDTTAEPPSKCRSPVRLELYPLVDSNEAAAPPAGDTQGGLPNTCVEGFVPTSDGKCSRPDSAPAYRCDRNDFEDCKEQCAKGNADSCYNAGIGPLSRVPIPPNHPEYAARRQADAVFMEKACDGGVGIGCHTMGLTYSAQAGGMYDLGKAMSYFKKACFEQFFGTSCIFLANYHLDGNGVPKDPIKAHAMMQRGCNLGSTSACSLLGSWYIGGNPKAKIAKDPKKGESILAEACDQGKLGYACLDLHRHYAKSKNPAAAEYKAKGCALEPKSTECR